MALQDLQAGLPGVPVSLDIVATLKRCFVVLLHSHRSHGQSLPFQQREG